MTTNQSSRPNPVKPTKTGATSKPATPVQNKTSNDNKKSPFIPIAVTVGILLLGVIGFLMYSNSTKERALEAQITELEEAETLRAELEDQYNAALEDLESMRGSNEELNIVIDQQKEELEKQKNKIAKLIRDKKRAGNAKEELAKMKEQVDAYLAEIETLRADKELLTQRVDELIQNNDALLAELEGKSFENEELNSARAVLVSEKEALSDKVYFASVVKVDKINVNGYKAKNGKPVKKKAAKQIDQLRVCFSTTVNEVTKPGDEQFHVRIINPIGETLALEEMGSGMFTNRKTGEEIRFTQVKEYAYANDETELCFIWAPNMAFQKGNYDVEIYNKGFLAGTGNFQLK